MFRGGNLLKRRQQAKRNVRIPPQLSLRLWMGYPVQIMNYVISDIHGEFPRYQQMLETINFQPEDTLYVLGDVIDRGAQGIEIIEDIMARANVVPLLGNHEKMCLNAFSRPINPEAMSLWRDYNGGNTTYRALKYRRTAEQRRKILSWMESLPDHLNITVGSKSFHLVHAFPADNTEARIWTRPDYSDPVPFQDNRVVIVGHTVTAHFLGEQSPHDAMRALESMEEHFLIVHAPHFIAIDCGCGNRTPARRLACLRLEDFQEFYV